MSQTLRVSVYPSIRLRVLRRSLVVLFLVMLGGLVSPALGAILAIPVYAAFLVMLYVVMFGVMYFIWRDVCGGAVATPPVADHAGFEA